MTKAGPLKILIVDDPAALRRTVRQMLEPAHVTCLEADSGEEAVALIPRLYPIPRSGQYPRAEDRSQFKA